MLKIEGKVALISGGASGLGLLYAKQLLKHKLRGVAIVDFNETVGLEAVKELQSEFGQKSAIFVTADVRNYQQFENAFKETVKTYNNLDIVVNNAGIMNEKDWEATIAVNLNGTINGTLLALEKYLQEYKTDKEGLIVNISSTTGLEPFYVAPVYSATKFGVIGLSIAFGRHFGRTQVKVVAICPGLTDTPLLNVEGKFLSLDYERLLPNILEKNEAQRPESVAKGFIEIIQIANSSSIWVIEGGEKPYEYNPTPRKFLKK